MSCASVARLRRMRIRGAPRALYRRGRALAARVRDRVLGRRRAYAALVAEAPPHPATFSEKVLYKMAFDRSPLLHTFADKYATRRWVAERVGEHRLPALLATATRPEQIDWAALPDEFVAKVSHGSGGTIVVSAAMENDERLPAHDFEVGWTRFWVRPEHAEVASIQGLLRHWLGLPFEWWPGRRPEWAYRGVRPRILIEELIRDPEEALPSDFRLYTFNGRVQFVRLNYLDTDGGHSCAHWDRDGTPIDVVFVESGRVWPRRITPAPPELAEGIEIAEQLTGGLDFVRVDLYRSERGLLVGELTNYPTGSDFAYEPAEFGAWAGKDWHPRY